MGGNRCVALVVQVAVVFQKVFSRTIVSYFFWSFALYLAAGVYSFLSAGTIWNNFCTQSRAPGFLKCQQCGSAEILTCDNICALDATWHAYTLTGGLKMPLESSWTAAPLDTTCVHAMLRNAYTWKTIGEFSGVAAQQNCLDVNCAILKHHVCVLDANGVCASVQNPANSTNGVALNPNCSLAIADIKLDPVKTATITACDLKSPSTDGREQALTDILNSRLLTAEDARRALAPRDSNRDGLRARERSAMWAPRITRALDTEDAPSGRALQTATTPDLPPWTYGDWSDCKCFAPCFAPGGIRTREALCEFQTCAPRDEKTEEMCSCPHCVDCNVEFLLNLIFVLYIIQAMLSLLVCLCFLHFSTKDTDDLVSIACCEKILGFFCKKFPYLIRMLTVGMFFMVLVVIFFAWTPIAWIDVQKGCKDTVVVNASVGTTIFYVVQVFMGVAAKNTVEPPAFLYSPEKPGKGVLYSFVKFLRYMGP